MTTDEEYQKMLDDYREKHGTYPDVIETDDDGNVVGMGSHADYDYHAREVQNGEGYYDSDGHYCSYGINED